MYSINKKEGKKYTFIAEPNWIEKIELDSESNEQIITNDVYKKTRATINKLSGELIICSDLKKISEFTSKNVIETYEEYLKIIEQRDFNKEQWVYNILDSKAEQNKILYVDDLIVVIPCYTWSNSADITKSNIYYTDVSNLHLLVFPTDKKLHTLRDLNGTHIDLLIHIKTKTLNLIKNTFNIEQNLIKMYIHYTPSTFHLHVHFALKSNTEINSSCEYSHNLNNIIEILKAKSDFYQTTLLDKRI